MRKIFVIIACLTSASIIAQQQKCYLRPVDGINTEKNEFNIVINPAGDRFTYTEQTCYKHGTTKERVMLATYNDTACTANGKVLELGNKVSHINVIAWPDSNKMYVYKGRHYGKIYIYTLKDGKWKKSGKIKIGSSRIKKCCFDSTGNVIYFSSTDKKRGIGGEDLYMSTRIDGDKWSVPVNLGSDINSKSNDIAPVLIGNDMMVFSSNREGGHGGYDIYFSKLDSGKWSTPVNLDKPLNSTEDDAFFVPTYLERNAFLASNRVGGKGGMDIYMITFITPKLLTDNLPQPKSLLTDKLLSDINLQAASHLDSTKITLLKGWIMGDDSVYLKAKVSLSDNGLMQVIATQDAEENGAYEVILPGGANYGIAVSYPGYLFHSENFDLPEQNEYREIKKDIVLKKIAIGKNVALRNIFFETDKSELSEQSIVELGNVIKLLNENPTLHIELGGHTDNTGSKSHNQKLSEARAKAVVNYLIEHGIDAVRLTSKGYGFSKPVADNKTPEGRAENRRTEILVTKI